MYGEELVPVALAAPCARAAARAPQRIGELAEDAHALMARVGERQDTVHYLAEALAVRRHAQHHLQPEEPQLPARHMLVRGDAGLAQPLDQELPARRGSNDDDGIFAAQAGGDELGESVEQTTFLLVELERVLHIDNLGREICQR